jgi:large subunit ribosomal protein L30e
MAKKTQKSKKAESTKSKGKTKSTSVKTVDLGKEIRRAVDTGKVVFGAKQTEKSLLVGKSKLVIIASNAPELVMEKANHQAVVGGIPYVRFDGTGLQLGSICGKPFGILMMSIEDPGKSTVISAAEKMNME